MPKTWAMRFSFGLLDDGVVGELIQGLGFGESTLGIGSVEDVSGATEFTCGDEFTSNDENSQILSRVLLRAANTLPTSRCKKVYVSV